VRARLALALALAAAPPVFPASDSAAEPGVVSRVEGGARVVRATLPGRLVSYALAGSERGRSIYLLVEPSPPVTEEEEKSERNAAGRDPCDSGVRSAEEAPEAPKLLMRLDAGGAASLRSLLFDLPADAETIDAIDSDGTGRLDLAVARPGGIDLIRLDAAGEPEGGRTTLLESPDIHLRSLDPRFVLAGPEPNWPWAIPHLGGVRFYATGEGSRRWAEPPSVEIGIKVRSRASGLQISAPTVTIVGIDSAGRHLFAAGPEPVGDRRLRTILMDPASAEAPSAEIWSRLPGPERVMESFYGILDGKPVLVVTTRSAEKLKLLEEKGLRVFPLEGGDRSRAGSPPLFGTESNANLWQQALPVFTDVDGDGREDLVLAYYRGLKDDRIVLDTYTRDEEGGFRRSPRSTQFELDDADRSAIGYGEDLTGDGVPDLILEAGGRLLVYEGDSDRREGKSLVGDEPRWRLPPGGRWLASVGKVTLGEEDPLMSDEKPIGPARLADVDGDGRPEILSIGRDEGGWSTFTAVFLTAGGS